MKGRPRVVITAEEKKAYGGNSLVLGIDGQFNVNSSSFFIVWKEL